MQNAFEQLKRDKDVLSEAEKRQQEKTVQKLKRDFQRQDQEFRVDYSTRQREEMEALFKIVMTVVEELAIAKKYDLILPKQATLYSSRKVDVTSEVLKKLNTKAKKKAA